VTPRAGRSGVDALPDGTYRVSVAAPPHEGQANAAVIAALADHFGVSPTQVRIVQGHRGRRKIVDVQ
jgi:uncharacterized protein (TIGR00251 family)